ncbi:hypothetical protein TEA_003850 [Camellia sinensis var. sinensis]|uniref:Uncharacterized protein n=1 Tax=Camellia sinensis var. sinensis TaxID=542762 RepID=A0A4S4EWK7_CAMSN|nr:hypothetical protein TEA_003850 [Camellia sinensis var. sinensis]
MASSSRPATQNMASSSRGLLTLFPELNESTREITGVVASEPQPNTSGFAPLNFPMRSVEQKMAVQTDIEANQYTLKSCVETMTAVTNLSHRLQSRTNEVQQLNSQLALLQRMYKDARAEIHWSGNSRCRFSCSNPLILMKIGFLEKMEIHNRGMSSSNNYSSGAETLDLRYEALKCERGVRVAIRVTKSDKPSKGRLYRYPDAAKFRRMPLQFTEDLDILFSDSAATGEWAYTPSSGVMPHTDETVEEFHTPHDAEFLNDADLKVVRPSELNKKRPLNTDGSSTKSKRKKKFTGAALLTKTLDRIVNVVESSLATLTQTSLRYPSIAKCWAKLESIPGVSPDDELYVWVARLFL